MQYLHKANVERAKAGIPPLAPPSYSIFLKRAKQVPAFTLVRTRYGKAAAAAKFAMSSGGPGAWLPLQRVETDEWTAHLHLINGRPVPKAELEHYRGQDIQTVRVVVAIVIDCATRYVLGLSVSGTASSDNTKNALRMALSDKSRIARAAGAVKEWGPATGIMEIFSDAGSSFGKSYQMAAMGLGIKHGWGPTNQPKLRPFEERFNRTLDTVFLPYFTGRTFSNIVDAGSINPEQRASLTVDEFNRSLIRFVVDVHHATPHGGLDERTPEMAWRDALCKYEFPMPPSGNCLRANLGIEERRKTSGEGVYFANIPYNSQELQNFRLINGDDYIKIAFDPTDINHISGFFSGKWQTLKSPDSRLEGVPLVVWQATQRSLRQRHRSEAALSSPTVFDAIESFCQTSQSAIIAAGLGAIRPSEAEIERDEGTLRIGWTAPQMPLPSGDLSEQDLRLVGEFIPSAGQTAATEQSSHGLNGGPPSSKKTQANMTIRTGSSVMTTDAGPIGDRHSQAGPIRAITAAMSEAEWDRIRAAEAFNATFIETNRLHRLRDHVGELLRRTATRENSNLDLASSNRVAGRALFCVGDAGSGKTVTLRRTLLSFSALRPVDDGEPRRPILSINAPDQPSLNAIYVRLLQCMDYPSLVARSTEVLRQRFLAQAERLGVVLIHIDDAANMTVGQDAFRTRRSAQKIAACLRSLMEEEPPFSLVISGLEPTLQLLEHDDALARRAQQVRLPRVRPLEHKVIAQALHIRAKEIALTFSPDRDLIGRLVHAANQQFGLSFELAWHAMALAQAAGVHELGASHFAEAYFRRTGCRPGLNVFEASDWERIDTTAIIPKLADEPSVTMRRRR